jgi:DNA-binding transcriptional ArsR family regulator
MPRPTPTPGADARRARAEAEWFFAFANPVRLAILRLLAERPRTVKELATSLGLHQANASAYVKTLLRAGVIAVEKDGSWSRCSLSGGTVGRDSITIRHPSGRAVAIPRQAPAS